jgi:hypothetical protein
MSQEGDRNTSDFKFRTIVSHPRPTSKRHVRPLPCSAVVSRSRSGRLSLRPCGGEIDLVSIGLIEKNKSRDTGHVAGHELIKLALRVSTALAGPIEKMAHFESDSRAISRRHESRRVQSDWLVGAERSAGFQAAHDDDVRSLVEAIVGVGFVVEVVQEYHRRVGGIDLLHANARRDALDGLRIPGRS